MKLLYGWLLGGVLILGLLFQCQKIETPKSKSKKTISNFLSDSNRFPIAVWVQDPKRAAEYKEIGINLYVGLWAGPTEEQLNELRKVGMHTICALNEVGLKHLDDTLIVGWMHGDEPDNAQSLKKGWPDLKNRDIKVTVDGESYGSYGPPIPPQKIIRDYQLIKAIDPNRPVYLNLGQGVARDYTPGRGVRSRHLEDYQEYVKGADIVSFDIYPVNSNDPKYKEQLWYVARGVERLMKWTEYKKPVWCWICLLYTSPSPRDLSTSRMPSSA